MALRKINAYSITGNNDIDAGFETLDAAFRGKCDVSLTEYDTTTVPAIAAGSIIEINGALFIADADESITGSPADGTVYVKLVPSGSTATAEFTATAPVWDDEKQGWYSPTGGEENYRYLEFVITKSGASYSPKDSLLKKTLNASIRSDGTVKAASIEATIIEGILTVLDSVRVLTGTLNGSGAKSISYPTGFTQSNTVILSDMIYDPSSTSWVLMDSYCALRSADIYIDWHTSLMAGYQYRMVIGRIS